MTSVLPRLAGQQRYEEAADLVALVEHPRNARRGDRRAVADSLDATGWYGAILAQEGTGVILAGHTRRREVMATGATRGPVIWLQVDDERAERILLSDNRTAELASWDMVALAESLGSFDADDLPAGFTTDDLLVLAAGVAAPTRGERSRERDDARGQAGDADPTGEEWEGDEPPPGLWPLLAFRVPPIVLSRFRAIEAADDAARLVVILGEAGRA